MIDPATFANLMSRHGVTVRQLAAALNREERTINGWLAGLAACPEYIEATIQAIKHGLKPATIARMNNSNTLDEMLGVNRMSIKYWREWQQFPIAARYAVSWHDRGGIDEIRLNAHDRKILGMVNKGRFFRVRNAWRSRPVMGLSRLTTIRLHTPDKLVAAGLIRVDTNELKLTEKGRGALYNDH